jgi:hypothetical protein
MYVGAGITGNVDGRGGLDTLDYTRYTTSVSVNLTTGWGTGIGGGTLSRFLNIENVTGGSGDDTLVGNNLANVLRGGAGYDRIFGESGYDSLYGDAGNDYLDGGHDHAGDTLIGGLDRDTFVDHQHQRAVWNPLTGNFEWRWTSEEVFSDYRAVEDFLSARYWSD